MLQLVYHTLVPPISVAIMTRLLKWGGYDTEEELIKKIRGFSKDDANYIQKFRIRPCSAILRAIIFRTEKYTAKDHANKMKNYQKMQTELTKNGFFVPGYAHGTNRSFWLFPLVVPNKV